MNRVKISEDKNKGPVNVMHGAFLDYSDINALVGKLLTYVDATYQDKEQRDAHKSLVRNTIRDWYYDCEVTHPVRFEGYQDLSNDSLVKEYFQWDKSKEDSPTL